MLPEPSIHEFKFRLPPGYHWEIIDLTLGRARLQATDGLFVDTLW